MQVISWDWHTPFISNIACSQFKILSLEKGQILGELVSLSLHGWQSCEVKIHPLHWFYFQLISAFWRSELHIVLTLWCSGPVLTYMPQDFRSVLLRQQRERSEKRRQTEVDNLMAQGGTIHDKYGLLWKQQMERCALYSWFTLATVWSHPCKIVRAGG